MTDFVKKTYQVKYKPICNDRPNLTALSVNCHSMPKAKAHHSVNKGKCGDRSRNS
jgi:hypothetical protein